MTTAPSVAAPDPLSPVQQEVLDQLRSPDRPRFRDDLRDHLAAELDSALSPLADRAPEPVFVSKHRLGLVHGCETRYLAEERQPFAWSPPTARGVVAHKAIELLVGWPRTPHPLDLVAGALESLERDQFSSLQPYLTGLAPAERAELIAAANEKVAAFLETFPPLKRAWRPVTESRVRVEVAGGRVILAGKIDLSLGQALEGTIAGKVIIDLKTGAPRPVHVEDLRYYALLETLRIGVPPRLLVNYHLDAGRPRSEPVTEELLWSTARRVVDGVAVMVELAEADRPPTVVPSWACRWCPALPDCEPGRAQVDRDTGDADDRPTD
jgi:hypothetical protein